METFFAHVIGWVYPLIMVVVIIIAATQRFKGKPWLMAYLIIGLIVTVIGRIPNTLMLMDIDFNYSAFYMYGTIPLHIIGVVGLCLMIPFVISAGRASGGVSGPTAHQPLQNAVSPPPLAGQAGPPPVGSAGNPLYGVHGWLKFFVVVTMYIRPVLFVLAQIAGFAGIIRMVNHYPGLLVVGIIEAVVGIFFTVKWILIARHLRDIVPGVLQETKRWLIITLCWNILSTPLVFMSGIDPEYAIPGVAKQLLASVISFAIWFSYFNVSKRVKATYTE